MVILWYYNGIIIGGKAEELRIVDGQRTDEYRNYLPFDLDNQKNNSTFAVRYLDSSAPALSLAHYHL